MQRLKSDRQSDYLPCQRRYVYWLLMASGGMMGAYTYTLRGGVFCNAQTANVVMMSIAFGQGRIKDALYFLIPISAYMMGAFISEIMPTPMRRLGRLRWETCLIAVEALLLFGIGWLPLTIPHQVVQVLVNFIASMQYNTFKEAEGVPMATTFCTNHVRQVGIAAAKAVRAGSIQGFKLGFTHLGMLACFLCGGIILSYLGKFFMAKAIWLTLIPLGIILVTLIRGDLASDSGERAA